MRSQILETIDFLDNYYNRNESPNAIDTINSTENIAGAHVANQEHQNYYDWQDQQYIACKYNGGLEQVTLELVPSIIIEEEEDVFHQWSDQYDQWDNTSYLPVNEDDVGGSHTFNVDNPVFNLTKIKWDGTSKTSVVSNLSESSNKLDLYISKRQS